MPINGNNMHGQPPLAERIADYDRRVNGGLEVRIDNALADLKIELLKAMTEPRSMASAHEGHSMIREELDELWDHVKADTGQGADARKEALQVAAMGLRYALDVTGL